VAIKATHGPPGSYGVHVDPLWRRKLLIVDDDPLVGRMLRDGLTPLGFEIREATSAVQARRALREFDPDLAVVDLELRGGPSGVDLAHVIHAEHPGVGVVILTRFPDLKAAGYADDALPPGVGFVRKDAVENPVEIEAALNAVAAERSADIRHDRDVVPDLAGLTRAQREVLALVAQGYDNEAIADMRGCSRSSVANLLVGIYRRLGIEQGGLLNPRVEAVRLYTAAVGLPERPGE
jgi:DNA-binding NarL/FixJ family response regulator